MYTLYIIFVSNYKKKLQHMIVSQIYETNFLHFH